MPLCVVPATGSSSLKNERNYHAGKNLRARNGTSVARRNASE
jgi:hypothetical protein